MFDNITDAEAALAVATSQLKEDFLVKALQMCDDFGYNVQVVQNARTLLKNLRKAEEGFQKIFSRAPKYNFKVLKKIVSFCQKNSLTAMPNYPRGNFLLQKLKKAREIMIDGMPHVMIFPNLFIAEIQIFVIQPVSAHESIQNVTAIQFKGAPDMNRRLRQQTMGSVGPAGFLLADDTEMYERNQRGLEIRDPEWLYLKRGEHRERQDADGYTIAHSTDDLPSRHIWDHYKTLMSRPLKEA